MDYFSEILKTNGISSVHSDVAHLVDKVHDVYERPSKIWCPVSGYLINDGFYTISNSNGNIHGKVNNEGCVLSMKDLILLAYDISISEKLDLDFSKAELNYFKDESICTLRIPLGVSTFRNHVGIQDSTKLFLFIKTGFGGVSITEVGIFSHRFICSNGMEIRKGLNYFKAKHTAKMNQLVKVFLTNSLPKMINSVTDFTQNAVKFDKRLITNADVKEFRNSIFNIKDEANIAPITKKYLDAFNTSLAIEQSRGGRTAWSLLQAVTHYTNHTHPSASKDFHVVGKGSKINETAEKFCLDLL